MTRRTSKPAILAAAVSLATEKGLRNFSRLHVARAVGLSESNVSFHFGPMVALRRAVVQHAIACEVMPILADARADRESAALFTRMSGELKEKIGAYIAR